MNLQLLKAIIMDELYYVLALVLVCVAAFDLGLMTGWIWSKL